MAILFSFPALAVTALTTYGWLLWVQPWKVPPVLPSHPELTDSGRAPNHIPPFSPGPRSYLEFEGNPIFGGSSPTGSEGAPFSAGDPLGFNVHFRATGPNSVKGLWSSSETKVVSGVFQTSDGSFDQAIIDGAAHEFLAELSKEVKAHKAAYLPHTMMPGDKEFYTAFAYTDGTYSKHRVVSQGDLDAVKNGSETWIVISVQAYSDANRIHHLRKCIWLTPPATPQSIWHFCGGDFPDSD